MSDLLTPVTYDGDDGDDESRRRALKGLLILVVVAVVVIGLVLILAALSGGGGHHNRRVVGINETLAPTVSATSAAKTSRASQSPSRTAPATSVQPTPTSTANPCPSAAACGVPGDGGGVVAAVNTFRASHGLPAVPGAASTQALQCALQQGNGPTCAPHYAWQPVATQDGTKVVSLIAGRASGLKWLLDPAISSISVGWAYAGGQYECAILKVG